MYNRGGYDDGRRGYNDGRGSYNDPRGGYGEKDIPRQSSSRGGAKQLRPTKSPDNSYTFGNLVAVSPLEFTATGREDMYLMINGGFVLSARPHPQIQPGQISFSDAQRTWMQIALTDVVEVQSYDPFSSQGEQSYLGAMDIEVGFAGRKTTDIPYDQDELGNAFAQSFKNQIFAPGQQLLMDYKSIPLRLAIRTVELVDLSSLRGGAASDQQVKTHSDPRARGILTKETLINYFKDARSPITLKGSNRRPAANSVIRPDFKFESMGIGGLDAEFSDIFRRAFASRMFPPGLVSKLAIQHVRGMLLYGPPGTGKTLIARQIGKMLNAREPKVINGPEVLNKFVGQSEENIRKLFADAEKEQKEKGDESGLHIIIFDELDAICKQRSGGSTGGTGVGDSVVNQLLSKLDGVDQLNNILLIGMTNRKDMIDEALLRPGRLEVHMEISLPDEHGRQQILDIHTGPMRKNGVLDPAVDTAVLAKKTRNFTGAEISGLVRSASSFAFNRHIKVGTVAAIDDSVVNMKVNEQDFDRALEEVKPQFGSSDDSLSDCVDGGIMHYSRVIDSILRYGHEYTAQVRCGGSQLLTVLVHGPKGSGKTALAAKIALDSEFPFMKLIQPMDMIGMNELQKVQFLHKVVTDAYKSPLNVLVLDNIEKIIDYVPIGPRFSASVLSALSAIMNHKPPKGRPLLFIATTSDYMLLRQLQLDFHYEIAVPRISKQQELAYVMHESGDFNQQEIEAVLQEIEANTGSKTPNVGIQAVLRAIVTVRSSNPDDKVSRFAQIISEDMARSKE